MIFPFQPRIALFLEGEGNNFYQLGLSFHLLLLLLLSRNAKRDVVGEFFRHFLSFLSVIVYVTYFLIFSFPWARKRCLIWGNYQVEVEALVIQGPKLATVMNQVKKLEVTVLVLGQRRPSTLFSWWVQDSNLWYLKTVYSSPFDLWIYWVLTLNILLVGFLAASVRQATSKILLSGASTMQSAGLLV